MPRWTGPLLGAVLLVTAAAACSDDEPASAVIVESDLSPHPVSAISAVLTVETEEPALVTTVVDGPGGAFEIPPGDAASSQRIPVVGMRADADYTITVHAEPRAGGASDEQTLDWDTGPLPSDLPPVTTAVSDRARMQEGITVFNAMPWAPIPDGAAPPDAGYLIAVDEEGEVVWYDRLRLQVLDIDTTRRGTFLVTAGDSVILEIDLFGSVLREWGTRVATEFAETDISGRALRSDATKPIDIDSSHHEITELSNGHLLTLSTEVIELHPADAARLCPESPEPSIVGDKVIELDGDGKVVLELSLAEILDPAVNPGSEMCVLGPLVAPPNWFYPASSPTRDWTHANALALDAEHNRLLVSLRHLDGVYALRYRDDDDGPAGEVLWSLGVNGSLDLDGEPAWHQHAVELEDDGSLLVYDNGNLRPGTTLGGGDAPPFSRAVSYEVDPAAGTARQTWEHRDTWPDGRPVYTPFLGDVDREPNGNVLITHGGGTTVDGTLLGRIVEVVPGDAADGSADEIVFDVTVGTGTAPDAWTLYRAERLPSLYFGA